MLLFLFAIGGVRFVFVTLLGRFKVLKTLVTVPMESSPSSIVAAFAVFVMTPPWSFLFELPKTLETVPISGFKVLVAGVLPVLSLGLLKGTLGLLIYTTGFGSSFLRGTGFRLLPMKELEPLGKGL